MKCVLEFGVRGGNLSESRIIPTQQLGAELASSLVHVFSSNDRYNNVSASKEAWKLAKDIPRKNWQSNTHFVSLSLLDGVMRGPASSILWKKEN